MRSEQTGEKQTKASECRFYLISKDQWTTNKLAKAKKEKEISLNSWRSTVKKIWSVSISIFLLGIEADFFSDKTRVKEKCLYKLGDIWRQLEYKQRGKRLKRIYATRESVQPAV